MKKTIFLFICVFVLLSLACNMSGQTVSPPAQPQAGTVVVEPQPAEPSQPEVIVETQIVVVTATPGPTEIPSKPVSIRAGLASLNSYLITISTKNTGPSPQDLTEMTLESTYSSDLDAQMTRMLNRSASADDPTGSESESFTYRVGLEQCTVSEDSFEFETISPAQKEMTDMMAEMLDMTPIISNPTLVGAETINGIETNHFTFQVSGLGASSGAQVLANQGEYWLALDGNYIVKYTLNLGTQDNEGQQMSVEVYIELTQVNQPVEIVMPEGCKAP